MSENVESNETIDDASRRYADFVVTPGDNMRCHEEIELYDTVLYCVACTQYLRQRPFNWC